MPNEKSPFPFMVFHEAFDNPDGTNRIDKFIKARARRSGLASLLQTRASPEEADFERSLLTVKRMAERDAKNRIRNADRRHPKYRSVMVDLVLDTRGRPKRGEPNRLAQLHGVHVLRVRKWIAQLRKLPATPSSSRYEWATTDWQTIIYGEMLREQQRRAGLRPRKKQKK